MWYLITYSQERLSIHSETATLSYMSLRAPCQGKTPISTVDDGSTTEDSVRHSYWETTERTRYFHGQLFAADHRLLRPLPLLTSDNTLCRVARTNCCAAFFL